MVRRRHRRRVRAVGHHGHGSQGRAPPLAGAGSRLCCCSSSSAVPSVVVGVSFVVVGVVFRRRRVSFGSCVGVVVRRRRRLLCRRRFCSSASLSSSWGWRTSSGFVLVLVGLVAVGCRRCRPCRPRRFRRRRGGRRFRLPSGSSFGAPGSPGFGGPALGPARRARTHHRVVGVLVVGSGVGQSAKAPPAPPTNSPEATRQAAAAMRTREPTSSPPFKASPVALFRRSADSRTNTLEPFAAITNYSRRGTPVPQHAPDDSVGLHHHQPRRDSSTK